MTSDLLARLGPVVSNATIDCMGQIFGAPISGGTSAPVEGDSVVVHLSLWEGVEALDTYFFFDAAFLKSALSAFHSEDELNSDQFQMIAEDAACELVNIIGNTLKKFLNENGFHLMMMFPTADLEGKDAGALAKNAVLEVGFASAEGNSANGVLSVGVVV